MTTSRIHAAVGIMTIVVISRLLGLGREMVVANQFGTSAAYDTYLLSLMLPALAAGVINFASFYLLVPILTRAFSDKAANGNASVWPVINLTLGVAAGVAGVIALIGPTVLQFWIGEGSATTELYCRILSAMVFIVACEAALRAILNARGVFTYAAAGPIIDNLVFIGVVGLFAQSLGIASLATGLMLGMVLHALFLLARVMQLNVMGKYTLGLSSETSIAVRSTLAMLLAIEVINRSYFLIDRYFAIPLGEGIISALNYSQVLVQVPDSIVGFAIASVAFPLFAESAIAQPERFARAYRATITIGLLIAAPMAIIMFAGASDIIQVVLQRGQFSETSSGKTLTVLLPQIPVVLALFIVSTSVRACYAAGWTKAVLWLALAAFAVKLAGTAMLSSFYGSGGIAAATSLAHWTFASGLLIVVLRRVVGTAPRERNFLRMALATAGASLTAWGAVVFLHQTLPGTTLGAALLRLCGIAAAVFLVYAMLVHLTGLRKYLKGIMSQESAASPNAEPLEVPHA